jgi:hypothetical protein
MWLTWLPEGWQDYLYWRENEAETGIEPVNGAFAEPCLTTWLLRHDEEEAIISELTANGNCLY